MVPFHKILLASTFLISFISVSVFCLISLISIYGKSSRWQLNPKYHLWSGEKRGFTEGKVGIKYEFDLLEA